MKPTGIVFDPRYARHDTGPGHPERGQRVTVIGDLLATRPDLERLAPRAATHDDITLVHDGGYVESVAATQGVDSYAFDPDTRICGESYEIARLAAGGVLSLVDAVMEGTIRNGFAFVRPPGHHAEGRRAMGFCLFNNIAIAAAHLRRRHGLERVLVMDWDVHHGNGTQHSFEDDPGVLYISTHQYPFYPGTGARNEVGHGAGEGFTVNLPFPQGFGDAEYAEAFRAVVEPIAVAYRPEFVLVSAGFDPHARDPLAMMRVTEAGFSAMARSLLAVARETAADRCVAVLEGGYDLQALRNSSAVVLDALQGKSAVSGPIEGSGAAAGLLEDVRRVQRNYWPV